MEYLIQALGLIASLSILVVLHEGGHFFFAKLFKTRVEKFYLFFNPWFSLFKFKKGETEYGIGWLPLGGYVKISGMIDESMDKEQMKQPAQDWEFRAKPAWQRLLIMLGGVMVNFILAIVIYSMILFVWGKQYLPMENAKYGIVCDSLALNIGLQFGDNIVKVDDYKITHFSDVASHILLDNAKSITIKRDGVEKIVDVPENFKKEILNKKIRNLVDIRVPYIIDSVFYGEPAQRAGVKKGDIIIGINDIEINDARQLAPEIRKHIGEKLNIKLKRFNDTLVKSVTVSNAGIIGVVMLHPTKIFDFKNIDYNIADAIPAGIETGVDKLVMYIRQLKLMFTKEGASQIGGFKTIGSLFPKTWDWYAFWNLTAFLSIILAVMNVLPIPALDGGHVMFLIYEVITGRKPNEKFMEYAQTAGMLFLLALLLFANINDFL